MKIYIACDSPPLSKAIEAAVARLGVECSPSCNLSTENAAGALAARETKELADLFFAVSDFSDNGLQLLQDLCVRKLQNVQVIAVGADLTPETILKAVRARGRRLPGHLPRVRQRACGIGGAREGAIAEHHHDRPPDYCNWIDRWLRRQPAGYQSRSGDCAATTALRIIRPARSRRRSTAAARRAHRDQANMTIAPSVLLPPARDVFLVV